MTDHPRATRVALDRIFNDPDEIVEDGVRGYLLAHPSILSATPNPRVLARSTRTGRRKVGVITGGGSGHEPAFLGYVGRGMLDAVAIGEIFSSPTAASFLDAMRVADSGAGVACLFGNYAGDTMNVRLAMQDAENDGIAVGTVVANDDVASAPPDERHRRRGVAGEILMWKVAGAHAEEGASLQDVLAVAQRAIDNTRSIGIGLSPCTIVANGHPNFNIDAGTMEVGIGHHGEPGVEVRPLESARDMAARMCDLVLADLGLARGAEVTVLLSGLGATPVIELHVLYADIADRLEKHGVVVKHRLVGNFFTSLEMKGATLTIMKLDPELDRLMAAPATTIGLVQTSDAIDAPATDAPAATAAEKTGMTNHVDQTAYRPESGVPLSETTQIVPGLIRAIVGAREWLSDIDGKIGDGDHGINMAKGFSRCGDALAANAPPLPVALNALSDALMAGIGGSMGPLYGRFFSGMARPLEGAAFIDARMVGLMLDGAEAGIRSLGNADVGDKTLMDTLVPAVRAFHAAEDRGLAEALLAMSSAAERGRDSTIDLVARIGRASRLGERSRGVLDAGATSCCLILQTFADGLGTLVR
ncbi:dihydroxyacetone kinase [Ameyamaea chiangmaiensis NBRC 103196]|uniref:Dihydroxyacetone kinase subunit L n=1 Tax=Ameyamaea chiangmaiensis TaxID=442969 RepID=A0A850PD23_9PROT|nr:dihydroxyacetone kinase subunit DhaL [Ameyamaea chiangmaiensis]MBS4075937.1 dihydroxyacetone kinase subunit L [Ameyamaea chiangmaiensis]NVN40186.1 dihydroxyacetone kinase subunit L [Ameyamaea chiangmaiensis]GBQ61674.1 dihydroxyacetone kinase [Ameyamaea chiangmaiensis NBRC 103196]